MRSATKQISDPPPSRSAQCTAQTDHVAPPPSAAFSCSLGISKLSYGGRGRRRGRRRYMGHVDDEGLGNLQEVTGMRTVPVADHADFFMPLLSRSAVLRTRITTSSRSFAVLKTRIVVLKTRIAVLKTRIAAFWSLWLSPTGGKCAHRKPSTGTSFTKSRGDSTLEDTFGHVHDLKRGP